jgi:hypothetical protein
MMRGRGSARTLWGLVGLVAIVSGCAAPLKADPPGQGVPRISNLTVSPNRAGTGCPVTMRFRFEDFDGDIAWVRVHVSWEGHDKSHDRWDTTFPVESALFAGKTSGEIRKPMVPERPGRYWYQIQLQDASGRKSNVLTDRLLVAWPSPLNPESCQ